MVSDGSNIYVAHRTGLEGTITKVDLSQNPPTATVLIDELFYLGDLLIDGTDLYAAELTGGRILKIDLSLPTPAVVDTFETPRPVDMVLDGTKLYVTSGQTSYKLSVIDLSAPNPTSVEVLSLLNIGAITIDKANDKIYLGYTSGFFNEDGGIAVVDLNSPPPLTATNLMNTDPINGLTLEGNLLYAAHAGENKVSVIDIGLPNPQVVNTFNNLFDGPVDTEFVNGVFHILEFGESKISKLEDVVLSTQDVTLNNKLSLYPNPTSDFIQISGLKKREKYTIYNILGANVKNGSLSNNEKIDIQNMADGLYVLKLENNSILKFIKE